MLYILFQGIVIILSKTIVLFFQVFRSGELNGDGIAIEYLKKRQGAIIMMAAYIYVMWMHIYNTGHIATSVIIWLYNEHTDARKQLSVTERLLC